LQERVVHDRLSHICHCDYDREIALVAEGKDASDERIILGVVRLSKLHGTDEARLSILISDPYQGIGLGGELIRRAVEIGRDEHLGTLSAILTDDNQSMRHVVEKLGFRVEPFGNPGLLMARLSL